MAEGTLQFTRVIKHKGEQKMGLQDRSQALYIVYCSSSNKNVNIRKSNGFLFGAGNKNALLHPRTIVFEMRQVPSDLRQT